MIGATNREGLPSMRWHYMSDLHLESQPFPWTLPKGDVLILAGDIGNAASLDPRKADPYSVNQRARVTGFFDQARASFRHVLLVAGNHEHYDGIFDDTVMLLRRHLPGITVLDDEAVEIGGVAVFGTTLWSDFDGRNGASLDGVRRRLGEYFFVKARTLDAEGRAGLAKFQPEDALAAHDRALAALRAHLARCGGTPSIIVSHHAPSRQGLNPRHMGNGLDGAFASDLEAEIAPLPAGTVWVHGHTHIRRTYRIGGTVVRANCRGLDGRDASAGAFSPTSSFDLP